MNKRIKKLSEFKDEKGILVTADLFVPISKIAQNIQNLPESKNKIDFAHAILKNNPTEIKNMLAILSDVEPEDYHCTAATVLVDVMAMLTDEDVLSLFGLQSETPPSSGSVSESTEG